MWTVLNEVLTKVYSLEHIKETTELQGLKEVGKAPNKI